MRREATKGSRETLVRGFEFWLIAMYNIESIAHLVFLGDHIINGVLDAYGVQLYYQIPPRPVNQFAELLNAVRGIFPLLKGRLPIPWSLVAEWRGVEPTEAHISFPRIFILAMVTAGLLRGWPRPAGGTWLSADTGLRPVELHSLPWRRLSLPLDRLDYTGSSIFISIPDPKGRWAGAKTQHARGDDPLLCEFVQALRDYVRPPGDELVVGGGATWHRNRFKCMVEDTGAHYGEQRRPKGVVEAGLRASFGERTSRAPMIYHTSAGASGSRILRP